MTDSARPAPYTAAVVQRGTLVVGRNSTAAADRATNREHVLNWIRFLSEKTDSPPKLIVFPVLSFTGASRRREEIDRTYTEFEFPSAFMDPIIEACGRYGCYVVTSCVERHAAFPGHRFHTGFVLGPNGLVLRQPKVQARSSVGITVLKTFEQEYSAALGAEAVHQVVETPIGRLGAFVESEQHTPEVARALAKRGVDVIVHPNLEGAKAGYPFDAVKQARAWENGIYLVSANAAFERLADDHGTDTYDLRGGSMIAGPDGRVLAQCNFTGEGFALATIDLGALDSWRAKHGGEVTPDWSLYASTYR